jgi:hypothetical protein
MRTLGSSAKSAVTTCALASVTSPPVAGLVESTARAPSRIGSTPGESPWSALARSSPALSTYSTPGSGRNAPKATPGPAAIATCQAQISSPSASTQGVPAPLCPVVVRST